MLHGGRSLFNILLCVACMCVHRIYQCICVHVLCKSVLHVSWGVCSILLCVAQPRHVSFEPAWAILEHELAAEIHISMKQYFARLKEMEPDNAFRPDTLVCFLRLYCFDCFSSSRFR